MSEGTEVRRLAARYLGTCVVLGVAIGACVATFAGALVLALISFA